MNKYIQTIAISTILTSFMVMAPVLVRAEITNGGDDVVAPANTTTATSNTTSNTNGGDDVVTTSTANTSTSNTTSNTNGFDDVNQPAVVTSTTPPSTGGPSGGTLGGSGGPTGLVGSGLGIALTSANLTGSISTPTSSCVYLLGYLKLGGQNNPSEVTKLQTFLKNIEKIDVDSNGIFDTKTFEAVKAFQEKYLGDVMGPWGVTTPTGQVWYTTKKKINEIYCKAPFALTAEQTAEINAYKNGLANGTITVDTNGSIINSTSTIPEVGSNDNNSSQVAAAGGTSVGAKIWNFIKWLFGY